MVSTHLGVLPFRILVEIMAMGVVLFVCVLELIDFVVGDVLRALRYRLFASTDADEARLQHDLVRPLTKYVDELAGERSLPDSYVEELRALIELSYQFARIFQGGGRVADDEYEHMNELFLKHQTHLDPSETIGAKSADIKAIYDSAKSWNWRLWIVAITYVDFFHHHIPELFDRIDSNHCVGVALKFYVAHWMSVATTFLQVYLPWPCFRELNLYLIKLYMAFDAEFQQPQGPEKSSVPAHIADKVQLVPLPAFGAEAVVGFDPVEAGFSGLVFTGR